MSNDVKQLDHNLLATLCEVVTSMREKSKENGETENEAKEAVRNILTEFPGVKRFATPNHLITWGENNYSDSKKFRKYLVDHGVDPEVIQAATGAAKTQGQPKLWIERRK